MDRDNVIGLVLASLLARLPGRGALFPERF